MHVHHRQRLATGDCQREGLRAVVVQHELADLVAADFLGKPVWLWLAFMGIVIALLGFDLGVLHKDDREIEVRESLLLSGGYIGIAALFNLPAEQREALEQAADSGIRHAALVHFVERVGADEADALRRALAELEAKYTNPQP